MRPNAAGLTAGLALLILLLAMRAQAVVVQPLSTAQHERLARGAASFLASQQRHQEALAALPTPALEVASGELRGDLLLGLGLDDAALSEYGSALSSGSSSVNGQRIRLKLARLAMAQGQTDVATRHLAAMEQAAGEMADERLYLQARIALSKKRYGTAADLTERITRNSIWKAYLHYDLGIALSENWEIGRKWLDGINHMVRFSLDDPEFLALADKTNLTMTLISLDKKDMPLARHHIGRVRKQGPLSNEALMIAGLTSSLAGDHDQALAHLFVLRDRNQRDKPSLEALLAIPREYEKLGNLRVAVINYELAAARFDELQKEIDNAVLGVNQGRFLDALDSGVIMGAHDRRAAADPVDGAGLIGFLYDELADEVFHDGMRRYLRLLDARELLASWQRALPVLRWSLDKQTGELQQGLTALRRYRDDAVVPALRDRLTGIVRRFDGLGEEALGRELASAAETRQLRLLERIGRTLERLKGHSGLGEERREFRLYAGVLKFRLRKAAGERRRQVRQQLAELERQLGDVAGQLDELPRRVDRRLARLRSLQGRAPRQIEAIDKGLQRVSRLLLAQGDSINDRATAVLALRREHLDKLYLNARHSHVRLLDELLKRQVTP
jgi:tetratricopeptide (TPR) repeat protein